MRLRIWKRSYRIDTFEQASRLYEKLRGDKGSRAMRDGIVYDDDGLIQIARISYNGKVWRPGEWKPGDEPLWPVEDDR